MIFICTGWIDPNKRFWPNMTRFLADCVRTGMDVEFDELYREPYHHALQTFVKRAKEKGAEYILIVEDDHWGFKREHLEMLLAADKDFIGMVTFQRRCPERTNALVKKYPERSLLSSDPQLIPINYVQGQPLVQECDQIGLDFTLIKMSVFDRLNRDPFATWDDTSLDGHLCQACLDVGIKPHTHFKYMLAHGDFPTPEERDLYVKTFRLPKLRRKTTAPVMRFKIGKVKDATNAEKSTSANS